MSRLLTAGVLQQVKNRSIDPPLQSSYLTVQFSDYLLPSANLGAWAAPSALRFRIRNMQDPGNWTTYGFVAGSSSTANGLWVLFSNADFRTVGNKNWKASEGYNKEEFKTENWIDCVYIQTLTRSYFFSDEQSHEFVEDYTYGYQVFLGAPSSVLGIGCDVNLIEFYDLTGYSGTFTKEDILALTPSNRYDFSEGTGNIVADKQGNNDLTIIGTANWQT